MLYLITVVIVYLLITAYLGYLGYSQTKNAADYLVAGRKQHPLIMALSYGATFISTSAIVGFGGAAAVYGMGLLWLTFCNIFIGIFIAFVVFGKRTRQMGHNLDAHTFPELLGKRFNSTFLTASAGLIIFIGMPLYAGAVMIGGAQFISQVLGTNYDVALLFFTAIVAIYVIMGGLKGVMYTDAFQGGLMFVGMTILIIVAYAKLGGIFNAHTELTSLSPEAFKVFGAKGHLGWTAMPVFGSVFWSQLVTTIVLGVGIGVLAQPQLVVRFMTVKSDREINRAVAPGGIFILMMTGVAFVVGALSNVYFTKFPITPEPAAIVAAAPAAAPATAAAPVKKPAEKQKPAVAVTPAVPAGPVPMIAIKAAKGNVDNIIPLFIKTYMPPWFPALFMVTLLAAAMSTLSSQFHTMGTAFGRDFCETGLKVKSSSTVFITRIGMAVTILISLFLAFGLPKFFEKGSAIIAIGTSIFFALCAASFLPLYFGALYSKRITKAGAIAGMFSGLMTSVFWLLFVHSKESTPLGLCKALFGVDSLAGKSNLQFVDAIVFSLPVAIIVTIVVTWLTKPPEQSHLTKCFNGISK
jgi:SSS family solute:Na+ symporter